MASGRRPLFPRGAPSAILVLLGALLLAYPAVSELVSSGAQSRAIVSYEETTQTMDDAEIEEEWAAAEAYNESLAGDPVRDPFVPGSGYAIPDNYEQVLNVNGDGVMATIEIPVIGLRLPVYHGTSEEALEHGVGHLEQTPLPIGGLGRRSVLTGHRGLPSAELFTRLDELSEGDLVLIHVLGETLAYRVYATEVIEPEELSSLAAEPGRDLLTLVTCTPYGVNTHRLLVHCERTAYDPDEQTEPSAPPPFGDAWLRALGLILAVVALVVLLIVSVRRRIACSRGALAARAPGRRERRGRGRGYPGHRRQQTARRA